MIRSFSKRRATFAKPPPLGLRDEGSLFDADHTASESLFYADPHFSAYLAAFETV